jgi:hypothetical protein
VGRINLFIGVFVPYQEWPQLRFAEGGMRLVVAVLAFWLVLKPFLR